MLAGRKFRRNGTAVARDGNPTNSIGSTRPHVQTENWEFPCQSHPSGGVYLTPSPLHKLFSSCFFFLFLFFNESTPWSRTFLDLLTIEYRSHPPWYSRFPWGKKRSRGRWSNRKKPMGFPFVGRLLDRNLKMATPGTWLLQVLRCWTFLGDS